MTRNQHTTAETGRPHRPSGQDPFVIDGVALDRA